MISYYRESWSLKWGAVFSSVILVFHRLILLWKAEAMSHRKTVVSSIYIFIRNSVVSWNNTLNNKPEDKLWISWQNIVSFHRFDINISRNFVHVVNASGFRWLNPMFEVWIVCLLNLSLYLTDMALESIFYLLSVLCLVSGSQFCKWLYFFDSCPIYFS